MKNCVICKKLDGKYKCPVCLVYYCSVACCNEHKNTNCKLVERQSEETPRNLGNTHEFETADTVPVKKLKLLEEDKDLKNILGNSHLRTLLTTIDKSNEPEIIMQKAMIEPIFVEFADACLKIIEPQEKMTIKY